MNGRPRLSQLGLWQQHEQACLDVLRTALASLAGFPSATEDDLNREFYFLLVGATQAAARSGLRLSAPVPEARNPPSPDDAVRASREHKRPDFYWAVIDDLEPDPRRAARQFVVECKRLDVPTTAWVFTFRYVADGVRRFVTPDHGYGRNAWSGAMIGYLQRLTSDEARREVCEHLARNALPTLTVTGSIDPTLWESNHSLRREFPESPFQLTHIWSSVN